MTAPGRAQAEHQDHRREQDKVRVLGEGRGPEVPEDPDEQTAHKRPGDAPHAPQDDHDEGQGENLELRALIPAEERRAERTAEPNEQAGKAE